MNVRFYDRGICRTCGHVWPLPEITAEPILQALIGKTAPPDKRLDVCPKCRSIRVSFPYCSGPPIEKAVAFKEVKAGKSWKHGPTGDTLVLPASVSEPEREELPDSENEEERRE